MLRSLGGYRYRIKATGHSSLHYGVCEVCHKPAASVYHQVEQRQYTVNGETGWTEDECCGLFGHEECLLGARREMP